MNKPKISIIVVNWNGKKFLKDCFDSLCVQEYKDFEIIFVDNASTDDSIEFIKKEYSKKIDIKIIRNPENYGFAKANNIGAREARGEFLLLLNNDTKLPINNLKILMEEYPGLDNPGAVGCEMRNFENKLQHQGLTIDLLGYPLKDPYPFNKGKIRKVFYPEGSFYFIKKEIYTSLRGLDETFFMFVEELDLAWRIMIKGYNNYVLTNCYYQHIGGGSSGQESSERVITTSEMKVYQREKNTLRMLIKNYPAMEIVKYLPMHLLVNITEMIYWLIKLKPRIIKEYLKAWRWNLLYLGDSLKRRNLILPEVQREIRHLQQKKIQKVALFRSLGFKVGLKK